MHADRLQLSQVDRYGQFYVGARRALSRLRFDVNYRKRRLHEVFAELNIATEKLHVLEVGFGDGELLRSFPSTCSLTGVEISESAVRAARHDARFAAFAQTAFFSIPENSPEAMPALAADLVISSHVLEHAVDDLQLLREIRARTRPGGWLAVFVPIEEPDYILFHRRNYSLQSIANRITQAGFEVVFCEGSLYVNGHFWKLLTIPSRRHWPVVRHLVDATRVTTLGLIPYALVKRLDRLLFRLGVGARQALVIARRETAATAESERPQSP